jgi:hypothetical protein
MSKAARVEKVEGFAVQVAQIAPGVDSTDYGADAATG